MSVGDLSNVVQVAYKVLHHVDILYFFCVLTVQKTHTTVLEIALDHRQTNRIKPQANNFV